MIECRQIIDEWAVEFQEEWNFTPETMEHIRDGLSEAYNAGAASVTGNDGPPPSQNEPVRTRSARATWRPQQTFR